MSSKTSPSVVVLRVEVKKRSARWKADSTSLARYVPDVQSRPVQGEGCVGVRAGVDYGRWST